jgi:hypothetical protein
MTAATPGQAAYEAFSASVSDREPSFLQVAWDELDEVGDTVLRRRDFDAAAQAAFEAGMRTQRGIDAFVEHNAPAPGLAAAMARVRRVLEDSPTASIARREALEIINSLGLPS